MLLGLAYRTAGSPEMIGRSEGGARSGASLDPSFVPARFYLASMYLEKGRPAQAKEEMESALTQAPGRPQFLAMLGEAERQLKNPKRSVELNRQALQADDSFAQARYYLALALFDLQQREEAVRELERIVSSGAKVVEPYLSLGTAYIDAGRTDAAIQTLQSGHPDRSRGVPTFGFSWRRAYRLKGQFLRPGERTEARCAREARRRRRSTYSQQQVDTDLSLETGLLELQQGRLAAAAGGAVKRARDGSGSRDQRTGRSRRSNLRQGACQTLAPEYAAPGGEARLPAPRRQAQAAGGEAPRQAK